MILAKRGVAPTKLDVYRWLHHYDYPPARKDGQFTQSWFKPLMLKLCREFRIPPPFYLDTKNGVPVSKIRDYEVDENGKVSSKKSSRDVEKGIATASLIGHRKKAVADAEANKNDLQTEQNKPEPAVDPSMTLEALDRSAKDTGKTVIVIDPTTGLPAKKTILKYLGMSEQFGDTWETREGDIIHEADIYTSASPEE